MFFFPNLYDSLSPPIPAEQIHSDFTVEMLDTILDKQQERCEEVSPGFLPEDLFTEEEVKTAFAPEIKKDLVDGIHLPQLLYFSHVHSKIPLQRVYGILMSVGNPGKSVKQPRYKGSVFVLPPENLVLEVVNSLATMKPDDLFRYAIDNVPVEWRFPSISYVITHLTLNEKSPYRKPFTKPKRYKLARKKWRIFSTNVALASILTNAREHPDFDGERIPHFQLFKSRRAMGRATPPGQSNDQVGGTTRKRAEKREGYDRCHRNEGKDQGMLQQQEALESQQGQVHVLPQKPIDRERGSIESRLYATFRSCVQQILQESLFDQLVRATIQQLRQTETVDASPIRNTQRCPQVTQAVSGALPSTGCLYQCQYLGQEHVERSAEGRRAQAYDTARDQDRKQDRVSPDLATSPGQQAPRRDIGVLRAPILCPTSSMWPSSLDPPPLVRPLGPSPWQRGPELHPLLRDAEEAWPSDGPSPDPSTLFG